MRMDEGLMGHETITGPTAAAVDRYASILGQQQREPLVDGGSQIANGVVGEMGLHRRPIGAVGQIVMAS